MDQVPESIDGNVLKALRELFAFPKSCFNPQGMITKPYSQTQKLYVETKGHFKVEPASAWPPQYDSNTHQRVSPDIEKFRGPDGIWYFITGERDKERSPDLTAVIDDKLEHAISGYNHQEKKVVPTQS